MARNEVGKPTGSATEDRRAQRSRNDARREYCVPEAAGKEVQFQAVLEAIGDGFIALDSNYHCTYVNQAAAALLNTTAEELTGRPIWEVFAPARYPQLHEEITGAAEQKLHVKFEEYCEECGHWFRWHCYPTEDGLAIFMEDVSERKRAEEQVAQSEEHYRLLFETMPEGVVYQDAGGKIISMNPAAERILGKTPAAFLGRTSVDEEYHTLRADGSPFPGREHPSMVALRTGQEVRDVVMGVYNPRDQAYRWINVSAVPLVRPGEDKPYQVYTHFGDITELRQAERALRHSERRFRKLFEADLIGIFITRPDGTFLDCNEAMAKMLGCDSREEVLQHRSSDFYVDPEFRAEAVHLLQTKGIYLGREGRVWRKDGSIAHLLGAAALLKDEETGEPYIQGVAVDITERKRAEEALRASEERYRKLFEANMAGVYLAKLDGTILDFNEAMMKMLGYDSREEVCRQRVPDFYVDTEVRLELVRLLQQNGTVQDKEVLLRKKDGSVLYALGSAALLTDERTGEPSILGVALDVTDRRKAEEELRFTEARFRALFEQTPLSIQIFSRDGRTVEINRAWEQLWAVTGLPYDLKDWNILHDRQIEAKGILPYVQRGFAGEATETPVVSYDPAEAGYPGRPRWLKAYIYPIKDDTGRILQVVVTHVDVTELVETEKALARSVKDLEFLSISATHYLKALPSRELFQYTAQQLQAVAGHAVIAVSEYNPSTHQTIVRAMAGPEDKLRKLPRLLGRNAVGLVFTVAEGTLERTTPGRLELVKGGLYDLTFSQMPLPLATLIEQELGVGETYAMPFYLGEDFMGTVAIATDRNEGLQNRELIEAIVNHAALALKRTRTEEALREREQALREIEQRLRGVLENSLDLVYRRDLQQDRYDYLSPMVEQITGFTAAEMTDWSTEQTLARIHPDDAERLRRELREAMAAGQGKIEYRFRRKDGQFCWMADHFTVQKDERGQPLYFAGVARDITRRKRMEERLRQWNDQLAEEVQSQTEQLRTTASRVQDEAVRRASAESELRKQSQMLEGFFQHTITPLAFLDRRFNFIRVNSAFAQAGGHEPDYFIGKNYFALHPGDQDRAIFERVVRTKQPYFAPAKPVADPNNPARPVTYWDWQLTPLVDRAGRVQSLVLNSEDVTQQQKAFSELEHRAKQLQKLMLDLTQAEDRERRRLADILHDDLQQLLAAAKFHLSLLDHGAGSHRNAQEIARQAKEIIKDAIEKSRSLSHELSPAILYQGSLDETFDWLAREMRKKYGLTVHVETAGPVELQSEPLRAFLFRAAQELLFNVVKHARVNEATVRVRRRGQYLCLSVSDRGRGLDPKQLKEIAGYGLLGIRERVELLGGRMKIKSTLGQGSKFQIVVPDATGREDTVGVGPRAYPMSATPGDHGRIEGDHGGSPLRVLLADDHEIVRQGIASLLREEATIQVVGEAADGREAINLAYQLRPDVVIMDVSMPLMNGEEATRQIKRHLPEIRVVALSMYEEPETIERMQQAGAEDYVLKTAPSEELLAAIRGKTSGPQGEQRRPAGRVDS